MFRHGNLNISVKSSFRFIVFLLMIFIDAILA